MDADDRDQAHRTLMDLCEADLRCLDAPAHLGNLAFDHFAKDALRHFEVGVRIGELFLGSGFDGLLPWGCIDNRPVERVWLFLKSWCGRAWLHKSLVINDSQVRRVDHSNTHATLIHRDFPSLRGHVTSFVSRVSVPSGLVTCGVRGGRAADKPHLVQDSRLVIPDAFETSVVICPVGTMAPPTTSLRKVPRSPRPVRTASRI